MSPSPRLIVVSNRAPVEIVRGAQGPRITRTVGGLAAALDDAMRAHAGTWIAWVGPGVTGELPPARTGLDYPIHAVPLTDREVNNYYAGFSNQTLWPLCHTFPSRTRIQQTYWTAYRHANERFAGVVQAAARPGDLVWINDFHLCLLPGMLRAAGVGARLGVFWHIPFPPPTVFGILRWREDLLGGLLGADMIGFQTDGDVQNFIASVRQFLDLPVLDGPPRVHLPGREVRLVALPVGIDYERFRDDAAMPSTRARVARLRQNIGAEVVLLGVDRLDYTKGIVERLQGFERFLERQAEWRRRVCLVQVTVPSRDRIPEYRQMKRAIDEAAGRIAGRFTYEGRSPLHYLYTSLNREQLVAHYAAADVALVTPLRDGMNLVAKEYVAARTGHPGVLVLSEFAWAADDLREAVLVNPYDPEAIRRRIEIAVAMSPEERTRRMRALEARVATRTIQWWANGFLELLGGVAGPLAMTA